MRERGILRKLADVLGALRVVSDRASFWHLMIGRGPVRIRRLRGHDLLIRPGSSDARVVLATFGAAGQHRPPVANPRIIWDLGSNIGTTIADFACCHPAARIVGVELSADNFEIAELNIRPWADRCTLVRGAVWPTEGTLRFKHEPGRDAGAKVSAEGEPVEAVTPERLLGMTGPPDYVKMDVEGTERRLLRENADWLNDVRSIKVELHSGYSPSECIADLRRLGFDASELPQPWWPPSRGRRCVVGLRGGAST